MKKKVNKIVEFEEKFVIPQISFPLEGILKGRKGFKRDFVASPIFGTHVKDRKIVLDNSGAVDVDYNYDFIREKKHISDEEHIKKYGTKYYEFDFLNDQMTDEDRKAADFKKKTEETPKTTRKVNTTLNSFFVSYDEVEKMETDNPIIENDLETLKNVESVRTQDPIDLEDADADFNIRISLDDDDNYEFDTLDEHLPKPKQVEIPSYVTAKKEQPTPMPKEVKEEEMISLGDIDYDSEEVIHEETKLEPLSMDEEILEPLHVEDPQSQQTQAILPKKNSYRDYSIPYEELFPTSELSDDDIPDWLEEKKEIINQALQDLRIEGEVITYTKGPAFTRYEITLASHVNVKKILGINENLKMVLEAKSIRIQAPIPGKKTVGIEVPNDKVDTVRFGDILTDEYLNDHKNLNIALGKNIDGTPVFQNIIDMPHALIAGATKSGKSVCINTILVSLLIKNSPERLKLILVDPKMVELTFYNDIPHLATPVINDPVIATEALKWACVEMDRRYEVLKETRVRNIEDYNRKREKMPELENLPFIVIIVDEFNDLVMRCGVEANDAIIRLAQKARAAGMHIILATQRPTVNVVNGTIKSNITCRIAFRTASDQDSRIILDEMGAEDLLGRGDMLIKNNGLPERVQGAYISDDEISSICDYLSAKYQPDYIFTHEDLKKMAAKSSSAGGFAGKDASSESDELLYEVACFCIESGSCSINSIQMKFGCGFNRASRIVALLEERNIVSPKNGTKGREILVDSYELKQMFEEQ